MSAHCCPTPAKPVVDPRYREVLWVALVLNAAMFVVELIASWASNSVSLLADSIDFFGDAANYALSLAGLGMALPARSKAALFKAACMGAFGVFVLGKALWNLQAGLVPEPATMGVVGFAAPGNVAVMLAALGVFGTGSAWPDVVVAVVMGTLALWGAATVIAHARGELRVSAAHRP